MKYYFQEEKNKIRNAFVYNILFDIKLSKSKLSKIIQSGGFYGALFGKLACTLMKVDVPLAQNLLTPLATVTSASVTDDAIQRNMR